MSKGFNYVVNVLALVFIGLVIFGVIALSSFLINSTISWAELVDVNILIIATSIVLTGLIVKSGISRKERKNDHLHPEKASAYKKFIDYFYIGLPVDDGWHMLTTSMTLWASDAVLRKYIQLIKLFEEKQEFDKIRQQAEKTILEIRREMGNTNLGILKGDLIDTVNRFENHESKTKTTKTETV